MKIYKRKDGRYSAQIRQPDGKYKTIYGKTKREVNDKYAKLLAEYKTTPFVKKNKIGVADWFNQWYLSYTVNLRDSTKSLYLSIFKTHVIPFFGNRELQKISTTDCQKLVNKMCETLKPSTVLKHTGRIRRVFTDAVNAGIIAQNPVRNMVLPKETETIIRTLDLSEIQNFIECTQKLYPKEGDVFEFFLLTGIRKSEMKGLTIENYNREEGTLLIEKQYIRTSNGHEFTPTKSGKSRKLMLTTRAAEIIEGRIKRTERLRAQDSNYNPLDFIFLQENGRPYSGRSLRRWLDKICSACGINRLKVHDLRHSYATLTLALGGDIKTVQNNMGHSSARTTLDIYATSTKTMQEDLRDKVDHFWSNLE